MLAYSLWIWSTRNLHKKSIYKKDSLKERFKTSYKLKKNKNQKLKSINFLKELVSEPSNIIYPESFVKRTEKQINKSKVNIKILDQKMIKQIGLKISEDN